MTSYVWLQGRPYIECIRPVHGAVNAPGFYSAGFCGMVQLGLRTCGVKIGGDWIYYWLYQLCFWMRWQSRDLSLGFFFCTDMLLCLDSPAASSANVDRVFSRTPAESPVWPLCSAQPRSDMLVYFGVHAWPPTSCQERNCVWRSPPQHLIKLKKFKNECGRSDVRLISVALCSEMAAAVLHCCSFSLLVP